MALELKRGDVFFTKGRGLISRAIRFFTRNLGERRTKVNHVGIIVSDNEVKSAIVIEALKFVMRHKLWGRYGPPCEDQVAIFRPVNLSNEEIEAIVKTAENYVGKKYGYDKIIMHLLDWCLMGIYVFRRLTRTDNYPICSWVVAHAFKKAKKYFGVAAGAASPDDIWDFIIENPDKYTCIHALGQLSE